MVRQGPVRGGQGCRLPAARGRDPGHRRRIRLGQDHAGPYRAGAAAQERGHHPFPGAQLRQRHARRPPQAARAHAGGVPGPVRLAGAAHDHRADRRRRPGAAPARVVARGHAPARDRGAARGRPRPYRAGPLPARVLGRAAPAHCHCPRADPQAPDTGAGRAHLGAGRVNPAAGAGAAVPAPAQVQPQLPLHQPRPGGDPRHGASRHRDEGGRGGRGGRYRSGAGGAAASLYAQADGGGAGRRSVTGRGCLPRCGDHAGLRRLAPNDMINPIKKMRKPVYIVDSEVKSVEFVTNFDM
ncbi:hypothetical protein CBM2637_A170426 [Cupriavidus taiwanensis]|nr:hypothetical protein CBM2637_A170426 [Cupriavidus taiwanensis]